MTDQGLRIDARVELEQKIKVAFVDKKSRIITQKLSFDTALLS